MKQSVCFVIMPFRPELHYFYLYIRQYLTEKHGLRVERGDDQILTKPLMDKIRDQIIESDLLLCDITSSSPDVFYELGLAHAFGKPVIFITQESPEKAPVDVRHFDFIQYDLQRHEEFLKKLDNAIQSFFFSRYSDLHEKAINFLHVFNAYAGLSYVAASREEFQARIVRYEQVQNLPATDDTIILAEFLLPKILRDTNDVAIMRKLMEWISTLVGEVHAPKIPHCGLQES